MVRECLSGDRVEAGTDPALFVLCSNYYRYHCCTLGYFDPALSEVGTGEALAFFTRAKLIEARRPLSIIGNAEKDNYNQAFKFILLNQSEEWPASARATRGGSA